MQEWKSQHNGSPPSTYAEKTQFRDLIRSKIRTSTPEGGEENFEEAVAAVLKALNPPCLPSTVRDVFDNVDGVLEASRTQPSEGPPDLSYLSLHGQAETHFWNITKAVRAFYQKHGVLPLSGVVPDMKARTGDYVALQKIYRQKAREDAAEVLRGVKDLDKGRPSTPEDDALLEKEVTAYCRTAMAVRVIYGKSLHIVSSDCPGEPNQFTKADLLSIYQDMQFNPDNLFHIVPCFQTWQLRYVSKSGDIADTALLQELARLQQSWSAALGEEDLDEEVWMQFKTRVLKSYAEMERAGEAELHNIAAVLGGMAAQEVIKVITRQYIPIDNVVILDGIQSRTQVFRI